MNLLSEIRLHFQPILEQLAPDASKVPDYLAMIKPAQNPEHGDYQANFAMPLAKLLKKKPPDVAADVIAKLTLGDLFEPPTIAGPGFINLKLKTDWLAKQVQAMAGDERLGIAPAVQSKTYVIDYSAPNVAKPLHVGHIRSTIIGEALCRILRFLGHNVIGDNHLGDWGTQFGMLLYGYKNFRNKKAYEKEPVRELARLYVEVRHLAEIFGMLQLGYEKYRDPAAFEKNPIGELTRLYVKSLERKRNKSEDDEDDDDEPTGNPIADAFRAETVKLHQGDPENVALWKQFIPACLAEIEQSYKRLDVNFTCQLGESFYNPLLPGIVEDLLARGIAERSNDAVIIRMSEDRVSLIQKRDGAFTYTTTDLATIKHRVDTWKPDAMLYVVDYRQADHFRNFFAAAKRWRYDRVEFTHVSFGSILGPDRRPFQTRAGGTVELDLLLDKAVELGRQKYIESCLERRERGSEDVPILSAEEKADIAEAVGIGAVKYADLSQNRTSDYVFSYDKMLATDGNTATYMQYAYARCRSIFRKGEVDAERFRTNPPPVTLDTPFERVLGLQLLRWSEALDAAAQEYMPHYLTSYLWDLSKAYSSFFVNCPVLKAETLDLRVSRLLLCDLTARVIKQTLELLGIRTVERM